MLEAILLAISQKSFEIDEERHQTGDLGSIPSQVKLKISNLYLHVSA